VQSEEFQREQFDKLGNTPLAWKMSAGNLLAASAILRAQSANFDHSSPEAGDSIPDAVRVHPVDLMLRGFALECLLKAIWLKRGGVLCADGEYLSIKGAADHQLLQLCDVNALQFSPAQRDVMNRLSLFTTSVGRYPLARNWSATRIRSLFGGGKGIPTYWATPGDDATFDAIVDDLNQVLNS